MFRRHKTYIRIKRQLNSVMDLLKTLSLSSFFFFDKNSLSSCNGVMLTERFYGDGRI